MERLRQTLKKNLEPSLKGAKRLAVLGIGSELRGDDGSGVSAAEKLAVLISGKKLRIPVKVFIGSTAPENLTGEIKRYKPSNIIILDTADFKERPGTVILLDPEDVGDAVSFSTHKMPARILVGYLQRSTKCSAAIICIQPKNMDFGRPMSKAVARSSGEVARAIGELVVK